MTEALTNAVVRSGLSEDLARSLARQTVVGAGAMLTPSGTDLAEPRRAVTSKGGTTAAGLEALAHQDALKSLMFDTVDAAQQRSRELSVGS